MKTIRLYLYIIMCTLSAIAFTACDKDAHDDESPSATARAPSLWDW